MKLIVAIANQFAKDDSGMDRDDILFAVYTNPNNPTGEKLTIPDDELHDMLNNTDINDRDIYDGLQIVCYNCWFDLIKTPQGNSLVCIEVPRRTDYDD